MTRWSKFWMKPWAWWGGLVLGPSFAHHGFNMIGTFAGDPTGIVLGVALAFFGLALIWSPFLVFKDRYYGLRQSVLETDLRRVRRGSASQNAWVDDDDIDGDGVGGDSLTRMGITDRDN